MSKNICSYCEYFDAGGLAKAERSRASGELLHGDCLNSLSPRFETTSAMTCDHFFADTGFGAEDQKIGTVKTEKQRNDQNNH